MSRVIIYTCAGRRPSLEIQKDYVLELLNRYPNVEYHVWNFGADQVYLAELVAVSSQIRIVDRSSEHGAAAARPHGMRPEPVLHYARDENYRTDLFVRLDADVVFLELERFDAFVAVVENSLQSLVSADVVPHRELLANAPALLGQEPAVVALPHGSFSADTIGCNWYVMRWIAQRLAGAGHATVEQVIAANFDIRVMRGFVTSRLTADDRDAPASETAELVVRYAAMRERHVASRAVLSAV